MLSSIGNRVTEYSVRKNLSKECIEQKNARRARSIYCSRNPLDSEFDEIPRTQGVCGRSNYLQGEPSSEGITQRVCRSQTYSKSKAQKR
jgi:hypothetical protein